MAEQLLFLQQRHVGNYSHICSNWIYSSNSVKWSYNFWWTLVCRIWGYNGRIHLCTLNLYVFVQFLLGLVISVPSLTPSQQQWPTGQGNTGRSQTVFQGIKMATLPREVSQVLEAELLSVWLPLGKELEPQFLNMSSNVLGFCATSGPLSITERPCERTHISLQHYFVFNGHQSSWCGCLEALVLSGSVAAWKDSTVCK